MRAHCAFPMSIWPLRRRGVAPENVLAGSTFPGSSPRRRRARPAAKVEWITGAVIGIEDSPRHLTMLMKAPSIRPSTMAPWTRNGFSSSGWGGMSMSMSISSPMSMESMARLSGGGKTRLSSAC